MTSLASSRSLLEAFAGSAVLRLLGMAAGFLVGMLLARALSQDGYGLYGTVVSGLALVLVVVQFGLPQLSTKAVAEALAHGDARGARGLAGAMIGAAGAGGAALAVVLWLAVPSAGVGPEGVAAIRWGLAGLPAAAMLAVAMGALRGYGLVIASQAFDALIRPVLMLAGVAALLAASGIDPAAALAVQAGASWAALGLCLLRLRRAMRGAAHGAGPPGAVAGAGTLARRAASMMGTELLRVAEGHYGVLMLAALAGLADAGTFRVAASFALFVALARTITNLIAMPVVARLHALSDRAALQRLVSRIVLLETAIVLAMLVGIALAGRPLIAWTFGAAYEGAAAPLAAIACAYLVSAAFGPLAMLLNMTGGERRVVRAYALSLGIGAALAAALIPVAGALGPAAAMIAAHAIRGALLRGEARRRIGIEPGLVAALRAARGPAGAAPASGRAGEAG